MRHVVDGTGERAVPRVGLDRGDHPHEVELPLGALRPEVALRRRLELGREGRGVGAEVEDLGPRALVGLAHLHGGARDEPGDPRLGIVEVAGDDRLFGVDDHARGFELHLDAMGAVVALRGGPRVRIDVERVVGIRLHARLAADAAIAVQVDDAVGSAIERDRRADRHARCRVAVVAAEHREVAPRVREGPPLDVLDPGAERAERHLVLLFARDGARVTADAAALVDHEAVAQTGS